MLKRIKNNRALCLMGCLLLIAVAPNTAHAQLIDVITTLAKDKMKQKVMEYLNIPSASDLWDNFVDYNARNSLSEKSKTLSDFNTTERPLSAYANNSMFVISNGKLNTDKTLLGMKNNINDQFNTYLYSASDIPFSQMGNGILTNKCNDYINSVTESRSIKSLEEVLNSSIITAIKQINNPHIAECLLKDLKANPGLIPIFNNTPETLDFYCKMINTDIRTNPSELLYWSAEADLFRPEMPKKTKLINPRDLVFDKSSSGDIVIKNGHNQLAIYSPSNRRYMVFSWEFLNFLARPDHEYNFENIKFSTDELGRISTLTFSSDKSQNKTVQKNPVKYNDIAKALTGSNKNNLYSALLKKYNVPAAASYAVTVNADNTFKQGLKAFNKTYKKELKSHAVHSITLRQNYHGADDTPSAIEICPNLDITGFKLH